MKFFLILFSSFSILFFSACSDYFFDETTEVAVVPSEGGLKEYSGPGSKWELALHSYGGFTLKEEESFGISMSGDYVLNSAGFYELNVSTSTEPAVSLTQAYMLEIPNTLILSQPLINDVNYTQILAMIPSGVCNTMDVFNNWIDIKRDVNTSSQAIFGTFHSLYETSSTTLTNSFDIISADQGEENLSSLNCNQGLANLSDERAYMHTSGNSILHRGIGTPDDDSDDSFLLSIPTSKVIDIASLANEYIGFIYDGVINNIDPVNVTFSEFGTGTGYIYTDVGTEVLDTASPINILVNQVNQPLDGFINLGINGAQSRCIYHENLNSSGKQVLLCTGDNPSATGVGNVYTMLLVSR